MNFTRTENLILHNKPTTGQERTHQHGAPFLFAHIPKGKKKQQPHPKREKAKKEDKQSTTKVKPLKIGKEHKKRASTKTKRENERQTKEK